MTFDTILLFASFIMLMACGWYVAAYSYGWRDAYVERRIWAYGLAAMLLMIERSYL